MRVIIAGSRDLPNIDANVERAMDACGFKVTKVISGHARGVDRAGERWAVKRGIPVELYPVTDEDWRRKGPVAGPDRNAEMASVADALVLVWDGESSGSWNMLRQARYFDLEVYEYIVRPLRPDEMQGEEL